MAAARARAQVGTGYYQTAVLAQIATGVSTIQAHRRASLKARRHLQSLKVKNVRLKHGDAATQPTGSIAGRCVIVTRSATACPAALYLKPADGWCCHLERGSTRDATQRLTVIEATPRLP
jgi:protein-L-isoaspartate O-methyltransferase